MIMARTSLRVCALLLAVWTPGAAATVLTPLPQCVESRPGDPALLSAASPVHGDDAFAVAALRGALAASCGGGGGSGSGAAVAAAITIGLDSDPRVESIVRARGLRIDARLGWEGYVLDVAAQGVVVVGTNSSGVFHGVQTLIQMLRGNASAATGSGAGTRAGPGAGSGAKASAPACAVVPTRIADWPVEER